MTLLRPLRCCAFAALLLPASLAAVAQRPGGGGGGGPQGGGYGGPGGGMGGPGSGMGGAMGAPGSIARGREDNQGNLGNRGDRGAAPGAYIAPRNAPMLGPPGRWWDDKKMARNLSLRNDQQRRMDDIFEAGKGNLVQLYSTLQREEARFGTMSSAELSDESKVFAAIDRVAQARADVAKANAHILLQIRKEMDTTQLAALEREIVAQR